MIKTATEEALSLMSAHITALNKRDAKAIAATLHFPHHRLSGTTWKTWETAEHYFDDFLERAGDEWSHSAFEDIKVCLLYTSPSPRDATLSRMPSSA